MKYFFTILGLWCLYKFINNIKEDKIRDLKV